MSNNSEQNGRQLSTEQAAPPTDPRTRGLRAAASTPESQRICRDFVWGICSMNEHCKYRHELDYDSMRSILKFCHDYQNRTGCTRPECTYLHASREEENLFLTSRVIPRVLAERYGSITIPSEPASEPIPQMMYMSEYISQPPPPPPPPSAQNSQPAPDPMAGPASMNPQMVPHMTGSMHATLTPMPVCNLMPGPAPSGRRHEQPPTSMSLTVKTNMHAVMPSMSAPVAAPMPSILAPPPPPPPHTATSTPLPAPVYTVSQPIQHPVQAMYPITPQLQQPQQPSQPQYALPVLFDPSRPPPPIHVKRTATTEPEAGPSKSKKIDGPNDAPCDRCIDRNLRFSLSHAQLDKYNEEAEAKRRLLQQKTEEFDTAAMVLRSVISPSMFRLIEEFLEVNGRASPPVTPTPVPAPVPVPLPSPPPPAYNHNRSPESSKQFLYQVMDYIINNRVPAAPAAPVAPAPPAPARPASPTYMDLLRRSQQQTAAPAPAPAPAQTSTDVMSSILGLLQNGMGREAESRLAALESLGGNGLGRLSSVPLAEMPPAARYPPPAPAPAPAPPRYPVAPAYGPAPTYASNGEMVPAAAPYQPEPAPVYVPYAAAAPPAAAAPAPTPPRPYYHPYPAPAAAAPAPYAPAAGAPPPVPAPAPPPTQPYQYLARMPQHYYPPYQ